MTDWELKDALIKLHPEDGDIFVLKMPRNLGPASADILNTVIEGMRDSLNINVRGMILPMDVDISLFKVRACRENYDFTDPEGHPKSCRRCFGTGWEFVKKDQK